MNNLKHIWTILAQTSSVDSTTNQLSIYNCLEGVSIEIDRAKIPSEMKSRISAAIPFQVISFWAIKDFKKKSNLETKIEFLSPKKEVLHTYEKKYEVLKGSKKFRNTVNFQGMPITEAGRYEVRIYQKNVDNNKFEIVAEIPLDLEITFKSLD